MKKQTIFTSGIKAIPQNSTHNKKQLFEVWLLVGGEFGQAWKFKTNTTFKSSETQSDIRKSLQENY